LTYIFQRNNVSNIWLDPANGGKPRPVTDFTSGDIYNYAFSADRDLSAFRQITQDMLGFVRVGDMARVKTGRVTWKRLGIMHKHD